MIRKPFPLFAIRAATVLAGWFVLFDAVFVSSSNAQEESVDHPAARINFAHEIAPILSAKCFVCHGPDADQRQAGLRLDARDGATARLDSGQNAIVPGRPDQSELIARILSLDDDARMPPADSKWQRLTPTEITKLRTWIEQGADWGAHWAFTKLTRPRAPVVTRVESQDSGKTKKESSAPSGNEIDRFIAAKLSEQGLTPGPITDKRTLVRRVYLDLIGLLPTPNEVQRFVDDRRPDAYARLIDRLLASPRYGERWGRHWLDVARYGDSNGSDENHAYPLAYHYRDFVIRAFNSDLSYDAFLHQQLAGDLLSTAASNLSAQQQQDMLAATGFFALGTKILAERDPVKKKADMVDEQIDTLGRALLGLTIGCARCHDHKFDPIPTRDYYALAGILHSSRVGDQPVKSAEYENQKTRYDESLAKVTKQIAELSKSITDGASDEESLLVREAESFDRGNVNKIEPGYISDPGSQANFAEYDLELPKAGRYIFQLRYAAEEARPGELLLNGKVVKEKAINQTTGGWSFDKQSWFTEGVFDFQAGKNELRIQSEPLMSHIDKFRLAPVGNKDVENALHRIDELEKQRDELTQRAPKPPLVMAIVDSEITNVRVHKRGNHLSLGAEVPRGFVSVVSEEPPTVNAEQSGRRELATWMTHRDSPAASLAARVIANRLWLWHFGKGLVDTPNNFGLQGARPTHPDLLDFLAWNLIEDDWSIKSLQRRILNSRTYQLSTRHVNATAFDVDPANRLYWRRERTRVEAEVLRDCLIQLSGRLDLQMGGQPASVQTQDPSPADLAKNRLTYQQSRRRSVYLPVVRSNVYKFLTLFDFPNAVTPVGKRNSTTVPTQALWLMNSPLVIEQAEQLARSLTSDERLEDDRQRIDFVYQSLFARAPTDREIATTKVFLQSFTQPPNDLSELEADETAWTGLCQALLTSNGFLYIE